MSNLRCDWQRCGRIATVEVRLDVPREGGLFTTHFWHRCDGHTPPERPGSYVKPLASEEE